MVFVQYEGATAASAEYRPQGFVDAVPSNIAFSEGGEREINLRLTHLSILIVASCLS